MKTIRYNIVLIIILISCITHASDMDKKNDTINIARNEKLVKAPNNRIVSLDLDEQTAIKIAEAVLSQIYGEKVLQQRPWKVTSNETELKVEGTLHNSLGGVAEIVIRKSDAKIISYTHGK